MWWKRSVLLLNKGEAVPQQTIAVVELFVRQVSRVVHRQASVAERRRLVACRGEAARWERRVLTKVVSTRRPTVARRALPPTRPLGRRARGRAAKLSCELRLSPLKRARSTG